MIFKFVGFAVLALVAVGILKFGFDLVNGTAGPDEAPYYINEQFNDVGVGVVPEGGNSQPDPYRGYPREPVPYGDVPQGTAPLDEQLTPGR